ncbi:MAG: lipoprotein signal peptidase [Firmicutes bacterium]|nr:lipoprotein signal peptidase [Bacillota bacterium]MCM1401186.1 lipoprotein signal peptidase [Bacteroides sp.]MCM1477117.1 lipoprotein signal peptidase [Bacteroides sp.]
MPKRGILATVIILAVIILDQILKIWVKTNFYLNEDLEITSWFHLHFIENNGMAFGMEFGPKIFLTLFRLILAAVLIWALWRIRKMPTVKTGFLVCLSLIIAGAIGNIIDCVFYGVIFNNPMPPAIATLFPAEGGYGTLFHGRVVDMLYFPLFTITWPGWMPGIGGQQFLFFQPIFNLADAAISCGMIAALIFYPKQLTIPSLTEKSNSQSDEEE